MEKLFKLFLRGKGEYLQLLRSLFPGQASHLSDGDKRFFSFSRRTEFVSKEKQWHMMTDTAKD